MVLPLIAAAGIQAAGSLLGGLMGNSAAKKQAQQAQQQFQAQMDYMRQRDSANDAFSQQIFGMVPGLLDRTYGQEDYYKTFNQNQQDASLELMNYLRGWDTTNYQSAMSDQSYTKDAQAWRDAAAQENRSYDLQRIATNSNLTQQERDYAIQQLARAQGIASDERAQEGQDIAQFNDTRQQEYADRYSRLMQDRITKAGERDYEQNKQDLIISQAAKMRDGVQRVLQEQGTLRAPELQGPDDIAKIATERGKTYTDIMDKLSERQMSQLEAGLIKRGMDTGADSGEQRSELIARLAPEYQKALLTAQQEATGIVDGNNKTLTDRFNALRTARSTALDEAQLAQGAGLDLVSRLGELNSGVLDRDLGSAADYIQRRASELNVRGPMDVGSGVYDRLPPTDGIDQFIGLPTATQRPSTQGMNYTIQALPNYNFDSLINSAISARGGSNAGSILTALGNNQQTSGASYGKSSEALGRSLDSIFQKGTDWLGSHNDWSFLGGNPLTKVGNSAGSSSAWGNFA